MISFLTMFPLSSTEVWKVLFGRSKVLVGAHAATIVSQLICVFLETRLCVSNPERCTFLSYLACDVIESSESNFHPPHTNFKISA